MYIYIYDDDDDDDDDDGDVFCILYLLSTAFATAGLDQKKMK